MKKYLLPMLLLGLALAFTSQVLAVPVKTQATVLALKGEAVFAPEGQADQLLKLGQMLDAGTKIKTGEAASLRLLLKDGSSLWLGENTVLTLTELTQDGEANSTLFSVFKGLIKATVQKLTLGSRFELTTAHGVAAVKGTEYEAEVTSRQTEIRVREGRVWLEDRKHERRQEIGEGKACRARERGLDDHVRDLKKGEIQNFEKRWSRLSAEQKADVLMAALKATREKKEREKEAFEALSPEKKEKFYKRLRYELGDTWDDLTKLRADERQAKWSEQLKQADSFKLASAENKMDFQLHRTLIDRHRVRVQMQEFLVRPAPDTIQFINYTKRETRTDAMSALRQYNQALPDRLNDAVDRDAWIWDHQPQYWTIYNQVKMLNSFGDNLLIESRYFDPVNPIGKLYVLPVSLLNIESNGVTMEKYERYTNTAILANGQPANVGVGKVVPVGNAGNSIAVGVATTSNLALSGGLATAGYTEVIDTVQNPGSGDWSWVTRHTYVGGGFIEIKSWAIDEQGDVINSNNIFKNKTLYQAYLDILFKPFLEIEATTSQMNGRTIDVVSKMLYWSVLSKTWDQL